MLALARSFLIWLFVLQAAVRVGVGETVAARGDEPEEIVVRLTSGRTFTAAVDDRTDGSRLWLRFDRGGISILRPVAWQTIERAWHGQRALSAPELQLEVDQLRSIREKPEPVEPVAEPSPSREDSSVPAIQREQPLTNELYHVDVVRSIAIDASIARWTGGVESDGVLLRVLPLDADGNVVAASGTLEVDLFGDRYGSPTRGQDYRLLGHWTSRLEADQVTLEGAAFRLPFQAVSPDFANDLGPYAVVHVRLTAPGHGTFDASTNPIRLRSYNGVRDRLQQVEGTRFFPGERTNRGRSRQREPR
ncbi:MAG TPA: hypothetical protein VHB99_19820 [Pirellulales bacterium]|nr:hypothetical protein [Pirellulales bacterium]